MVKFTKSDNFKSEYSCSFVRIGELIPIEGSDFLCRTNVFGTQIVVRKDMVKEGDIMLYAANETQLNQRFLSVNNQFEIGCRDMNANAEEVNAIMAPYMEVKEKIDALKKEAKNVKTSMENLTKRTKKYEKEAKKLEKQLADITDEASAEPIRVSLTDNKNKAEEYMRRAVEKTTKYTALKTEAEKLVKDNEHIVAEAKKHVGFYNKYGRTRCITLKGVASFGCLFTVDSVRKFVPELTYQEVEDNINNEFDTINNELFVKAYVKPVPVENVRRSRNDKRNKVIKRFDRMIDGQFSFHYDTQQFAKNMYRIKPDTNVDITLKIHGTSVCIGKLLVKEQIRLPFLKHWFNKFVDATGLFKSKRIIDYNTVYGPVYSSRTVIKNQYINEGVQSGYYKSDIWSEYGDIIYPYLDNGMTVYGEIFGYLSNTESPIQKLYDYGCDKGENKLMIYRITTTNDDGTKREWEIQEVYDWTVELMKKMGDEVSKTIHPIDILYQGTLGDLYPDISETEHWHENVLEAIKNDKEHFGMEENEPLCTFNEVPREGIVIRISGDEFPEAFKQKCTSFLIGEAIRYDSDDYVDIETVDNYVAQGDESVIDAVQS